MQFLKEILRLIDKIVSQFGAIAQLVEHLHGMQIAVRVRLAPLGFEGSSKSKWFV